MSKFRIRMKLQGLELEIDGAREDASLIIQSVGQQMSNLLQPIDGIIDGEIASGPTLPSDMVALPTGAPAKKSRRRRPSALASGDAENSFL
jgi:hypothetical protein